MNKALRALAASAILAGLIAAPAAASDHESRVRVLHASPDAPAVDIWLDGAVVDGLTNVPFATISDYLTIPEGSHQVQVFATGTDTGPVIDATLDFVGGTSYTVAATNAVASIEAQVIEDAPASDADQAQIRVVHFSADAPAVDIAPDGGEALVSNLAYPDATDYLAVPADTYDLEVRPAGTTDVALQLDPVTVEAGTAYSVFAIGSAADPAVGDNGLQVVIAVDAVAAAEPTEAPATEAPASERPTDDGEAPTVTIPPTDTAGGTNGGTNTGSTLIAALLLAIGGLAVATGLLRFRGARVSR